MSNYLDRFKWHLVSLKRDGFWIPNLIETCPYGAKNEKEFCYRILEYKEMGVNYCVNTRQDREYHGFVELIYKFKGF